MFGMPPHRHLLLVGVVLLRSAAAAPTGTIIASNMNAASVSIADVGSGRTIATVPTGEGPHEIAVSGDGRRAVVSVYGNRTAVGTSLLLIDLATPTVTRAIELSPGNQRPHGLAFLPGDRTLLVTSEWAQRVLVVDIESGAIDTSIVTGQATTHMVALTRDGSRAFTTNIAAMSVSAIDVRTRTVSGTFPVGARNEGIAVTPDGSEVWVGGNESHAVYVLDGATGAMTHSIDGFGMAYRIGIAPDARTAVISARVAVVDIAAAKTIATLPVGAGSDGVGFSPLIFLR